MKNPAITTLEIIIVLAVFAVLIGATVPRMLSGLFTNDLEVASQEIVHVLRKAQAQAATQIYDNSWGVDFDSGNKEYTFFLGPSYALRDTSQDILYSLPDSITFDSISLSGGGDEVVFAQINGETTQDGSISLSGSDGDTRTITINSFGNVSSD